MSTNDMLTTFDALLDANVISANKFCKVIQERLKNHFWTMWRVYMPLAMKQNEEIQAGYHFTAYHIRADGETVIYLHHRGGYEEEVVLPAEFVTGTNEFRQKYVNDALEALRFQEEAERLAEEAAQQFDKEQRIRELENELSRLRGM